MEILSTGETEHPPGPSASPEGGREVCGHRSSSRGVRESMGAVLIVSLCVVFTCTAQCPWHPPVEPLKPPVSFMTVQKWYNCVRTTPSQALQPVMRAFHTREGSFHAPQSAPCDSTQGPALGRRYRSRCRKSPRDMNIFDFPKLKRIFRKFALSIYHGKNNYH